MFAFQVLRCRVGRLNWCHAKISRRVHNQDRRVRHPFHKPSQRTTRRWDRGGALWSELHLRGQGEGIERVGGCGLSPPIPSEVKHDAGREAYIEGLAHQGVQQQKRGRKRPPAPFFIHFLPDQTSCGKPHTATPRKLVLPFSWANRLCFRSRPFTFTTWPGVPGCPSTKVFTGKVINWEDRWDRLHGYGMWQAVISLGDKSRDYACTPRDRLMVHSDVY